MPTPVAQPYLGSQEITYPNSYGEASNPTQVFHNLKANLQILADHIKDQLNPKLLQLQADGVKQFHTYDYATQGYVIANTHDMLVNINNTLIGIFQLQSETAGSAITPELDAKQSRYGDSYNFVFNQTSILNHRGATPNLG